MKRMYLRKNKRGITLIALVITIIVLLILASITINLTIGEGGIITMARDAGKNYITASTDEEEQISDLDLAFLDYITPWSGEVAASFASGTGAEDDPYVIENGEQLAYFASQVNAGEHYTGKYIVITQSINLGNKEFKPIGMGIENVINETSFNWELTESYFNGTLDGKGNTITGININQPNIYGVGLIGLLYENGVIKNLNIYNGTIIGRRGVGGIVGVSRGNIINCTNRVTVTAQNETDESDCGLYAGGVIGLLQSGMVNKCKNYGCITAGDQIAGGIVGLMNDGAVSNCSNSGSIIGYGIVGGITGAMQGGTISYCTNKETIVAQVQQAGGIAGRMIEGTISYCSNTGGVQSNATDGYSGISGGIVGWAEGGTIENVYNSGIVEITDSEAVGSVGGILGSMTGGSVRSVYNKGKISGGDILGGVSGDKEGGTIENAYYYTAESINGIGSSSYTEVIPVPNNENVVHTTKDINSLDEFLEKLSKNEM